MSDAPQERPRVEVNVPRRLEIHACDGADCKAPVFWAAWPETGRRHIFDVKSLRWRDGKLMAESHFAHCANARQFRKAKPK